MLANLRRNRLGSLQHNSHVLCEPAKWIGKFPFLHAKLPTVTGVFSLEIDYAINARKA